MSSSAIDAVLFDLDGTLLNTIDDLAASMDQALAEHDLPTHPLERHLHMVGEGVRNYVLRALPETRRSDAALIEAVESRYRELYSAGWAERTAIYEGVREMLAELNRMDLRLAVLSNKPDGFTREMVDHYFGPWAFEIVRGAMAKVPLKPDPTSALQIAGQMALPPRRCAYVGDTKTDMQTGRGAEMFTVGVLWGFRDRAELADNGAHEIIDRPGELPGLLSAK